MDGYESLSPNNLDRLGVSGSARKYVRVEKNAEKEAKKQKLIVRERGEKTKSARNHNFKFPKHLPESANDPKRVGNVLLN